MPFLARAVVLLCLVTGLIQPEDQKRSPELRTITVHHRRFLIPFRIDPGVIDEVRTVSLHLSRDGGKTWKLINEVSPDRGGFPYKATEDGLYWFATRVSLKNEAGESADQPPLVPGLKIQVRTETEPDEPRPAPQWDLTDFPIGSMLSVAAA
jgi:hypothetical protein